jgi:hypothetical protein
LAPYGLEEQLSYWVCIWPHVHSITFGTCSKHKALGFESGEHKGVDTIVSQLAVDFTRLLDFASGPRSDAHVK